MKKNIVITISIIALAVGGFIGYKKITAAPEQPRHVTGKTQRGTLIISVSGSGTVAASQQIDLRPRAAGDLVAVLGKAGTSVKQGDVIARIDDADAQKTVRDMNTNLESARLALKKLMKPADELALLQAENALAQSKRDLDDLLKPVEDLALLQAENALTQSKESNDDAQENLGKTRDDGYTASANTFLDLPTVMTGLEDLLFKDTIAPGQWNIDWYGDQAQQWRESILDQKEAVRSSYRTMRAAYDKNLTLYTATRRDAQPETIESLIIQTKRTVNMLADTVKMTKNYIDTAKDTMTLHTVKIPATVSTHQSTLDSYTATATKHLTILSASDRSIDSAKKSVVSTNRTVLEKTESLAKLKKGADDTALANAREKIREREESLEKLKKGADDLDRAPQELSVKKAEQAVADAREQLVDYTVRAPFAGILATFEGKKGDSVSSSTVLGTLVTKEQLAKISLSEVDIAKITIDQKATLTFDAIPDITATGRVGEIDTIGTQSQGVVTFTATIALDTNDPRIKPGMTVSASIITNTRTDVLLVPNSAVKNNGDIHTVVVLDEKVGVPRKQVVRIGLSNDESTEIKDGLTENQTIVIRTIQPASGQPRPPGTNIFPSPTGGRGASGNVRFQGGGR